MGRRRAEITTSKPLLQRAKQRMQALGADVAAPLSVDVRRLVHELEVHQIELEIQNEELRAARGETEAALERYTELYEFAPLGYAVLADDGSIRELNLSGARFLGTDRAKLVGQRFDAHVAAGDRGAFGSLLGRVLDSKGERNETCELTLVASDRDFPARLTATYLRRPKPSVLLAIEDITPRRCAEEALREAAARKDEFLAVLSHELRNPLTPISNSLYIIERSPPGGEKSAQAHVILARQVRHLTRIIDDLLDVSRIVRGKIRLQCALVEFSGLVQRTIDDHRAVFDERGIQLSSRMCAEPLWLDADATRLVQVLGNLLGNAAKFTPRGGAVEVSLDCEGAAAVLRVRDNGVGIAPEESTRLFEPFAQAKQNIDRDRGGLGLGLAMVSGLVRLHGGSVELYSAGRGEGAEFTVTLPLKSIPKQSVELEGGKPSVRRHRILVIEDNIDAAQTLIELLELNGQVTQVAHDGHTGVALAKEFRPDLVLCDIGLPSMDGYEVAKAIRADEQLKHVRLVALTGYALPEDLRRASEAGFDQHIAKPPPIERLEALLESA